MVAQQGVVPIVAVGGIGEVGELGRWLHDRSMIQVDQPGVALVRTGDVGVPLRCHTKVVVVDEMHQDRDALLAGGAAAVLQADFAAQGQRRGVVPAHAAVVERDRQQAAIVAEFDRHRIGVGDGDGVDQGRALAGKHAQTATIQGGRVAMAGALLLFNVLQQAWHRFVTLAVLLQLQRRLAPTFPEPGVGNRRIRLRALPLPGSGDQTDH